MAEYDAAIAALRRLKTLHHAPTVSVVILQPQVRDQLFAP
jgi:hypothetical protein